MPIQKLAASRLMYQSKMGAILNCKFPTFVMAGCLGVAAVISCSRDTQQADLTSDVKVRPKAAAPKAAAPALAVGEKAKPFRAKDLNGKLIQFPESFKGKLVLLDMWATWCGPCVKELPYMKQAYDKYKDKGLEICGYSLDNAGDDQKVKDFVKKNDTNWVQILGAKRWQSEIAKLYDVHGIPFALLVDGDTGKVVATGEELRGEGLDKTLQRELAKKRPS